jgi:hypothetical protein
MRRRNSREAWLRLSGLNVSKHAECYHAGDHNRKVIKGMVEMSGCVVILGIETGNRRVKNPTLPDPVGVNSTGSGAPSGMIEKSKILMPQKRDPAGEGEDRGGAGDPMRGDGESRGAIRLCAAACG